MCVCVLFDRTDDSFFFKKHTQTNRNFKEKGGGGKSDHRLPNRCVSLLLVFLGGFSGGFGLGLLSLPFLLLHLFLCLDPILNGVADCLWKFPETLLTQRLLLKVINPLSA